MFKNIIFGILVAIVAALLIQYYLDQSSLIVGDTAPNIQFQSISGKHYSLTEFSDRYVLITFWGSWCAPCRDSNKKLVKFYKTQDPKRLKIISVGIEKNLQEWENAIQEDSLFWDEQFTPLHMFDNTISQNYSVEQTPTYFLINPDRLIVAKSGDISDVIRKFEEMVSHQRKCPENWTKISLAGI